MQFFDVCSSGQWAIKIVIICLGNEKLCNGSVLSGAGHSLALQDGSRWITRSLILLLYN